MDWIGSDWTAASFWIQAWGWGKIGGGQEDGLIRIRIRIHIDSLPRGERHTVGWSVGCMHALDTGRIFF